MMSREVAALLLDDAGFVAATFESGEEVLSALAGTAELPDAMLIDMQMPGVAGDALARKLRGACGPDTRLIAMSGSDVDEAHRKEFDTFLMKPFAVEDLQELLGNGHAEIAKPSSLETVDLDPAVMNESTFVALRQTMPVTQLRALYKMCLDDVDARFQTMQRASEARDAEGFRSAAHSIKGGCGMVGAVELAGIAADFEHQGMPAVHNMVPFQQFLAASARLRGMLGRVLDHAD
jgi:CheY-like chemotaxis protein/HPt (histidine-containing phosphotransfer) domain-containing protein